MKPTLSMTGLRPPPLRAPSLCLVPLLCGSLTAAAAPVTLDAPETRPMMVEEIDGQSGLSAPGLMATLVHLEPALAGQEGGRTVLSAQATCTDLATGSRVRIPDRPLEVPVWGAGTESDGSRVHVPLQLSWTSIPADFTPDLESPRAYSCALKVQVVKGNLRLPPLPVSAGFDWDIVTVEQVAVTEPSGGALEYTVTPAEDPEWETGVTVVVEEGTVQTPGDATCEDPAQGCGGTTEVAVGVKAVLEPPVTDVLTLTSSAIVELQPEGATFSKPVLLALERSGPLADASSAAVSFLLKSERRWVRCDDADSDLADEGVCAPLMPSEEALCPDNHVCAWVNHFSTWTLTNHAQVVMDFKLEWAADPITRWNCGPYPSETSGEEIASRCPAFFTNGREPVHSLPVQPAAQLARSRVSLRVTSSDATIDFSAVKNLTFSVMTGLSEYAPSGGLSQISGTFSRSGEYALTLDRLEEVGWVALRAKVPVDEVYYLLSPGPDPYPEINTNMARLDASTCGGSVPGSTSLFLEACLNLELVPDVASARLDGDTVTLSTDDVWFTRSTTYAVWWADERQCHGELSAFWNPAEDGGVLAGTLTTGSQQVSGGAFTLQNGATAGQRYLRVARSLTYEGKPTAAIAGCIAVGDTDGFRADQGDCDDLDPAVYPGATDKKGDGIDSDCDGSDAPGVHVGLSSSSKATIQAALDAASVGSTVWVGPGTYYENEVSFKGKALTLRSTHGREQTIIDAQQLNRVMRFHSGETRDTVLDGFTLRNGKEGDDDLYGGAGMAIVGASPWIRNCTIRDNHSTVDGGAVYAHTDQTLFENVDFLNNKSDEDGGAFQLDHSRMQIRDSRIMGNWCEDEGSAMFTWSGSPTIENTIISGNTSEGNDNAAGTIDVFYSGITIRSSVIADNYTNRIVSAIKFSYSDSENPLMLMENVLVANNRADGGWGAVQAYCGSPVLRNVVVVGNNSNGIDSYCSGAHPILENVISAYNSGWELYINESSGATATLRHSSFFDVSGQTIVPSPDYFSTRCVGCQEGDPRFLAFSDDGDYSNDDYHLSLEAPGVDAGSEGSFDVDGSRADMGLYGGPYGDGFDLDSDGLADYFWPGSFEDVPSSIDLMEYDCDDRSPGGSCF